MKKFLFLFSFLIVQLGSLYSMYSLFDAWPDFVRGELNRRRDKRAREEERRIEKEKERKRREEEINNEMAWRLEEHKLIRKQLIIRSFKKLNSILNKVYTLNNFNRMKREDPYVFIEFLEFHINKLNFKLNIEQIKKMYPNKPILLALALKNKEAIKYFLKRDIEMLRILDINNFDRIFSNYNSLIFNYLFRRYLFSYKKHIEYEPNYKELYKWISFLLDNGCNIPDKIFDGSIIDALFFNFDIKYKNEIWNIIKLIYETGYNFTHKELKIISNASQFIAIELLIMLYGTYCY